MSNKFFTPQDIVARQSQLKSDRSTIEQTWDLIERFVMPQGGDFYTSSDDENSHQFYDRERYDDTAVLANQLLAATFHTNLTNQASSWFEYRALDPDVNKLQENAKWLQHATQHVHNVIKSDNFHTEASEFYLDDTGFGTAFMEHEIKDGKHTFNSAPIRECFFDEDVNGRLLRFYRLRKLTALQIVDFFGDEVLSKADKLKAAYEKSSTEKFEVIRCIQKNPHAKEDNGEVIDDAATRPYVCMYILKAGAVQLGSTDGYYSMPVYCLRWSKFAGSMWGYSQAMVAMGSILTVQELHSMTLDANEKALDPPMMIKRRGVIGAMDFGARGITYVQDHDDVKEFISATNISWGEMKLDSIQLDIKACFFQDKLELKNSPAMTATEVNARAEQTQRLLGGSIIRAKSDFLDPMLERSLREEIRLGKLPPMPESLQGKDLVFEYTGALARMQRLDAVDAYRNWTAMLTEWKNAGFVDVDSIVDILEMAYDAGQRLGVPAAAMVALEKARADVKAKNAAAAAAQQAEVDKTNAAAAQGNAAAAEKLTDAGLVGAQ